MNSLAGRGVPQQRRCGGQHRAPGSSSRLACAGVGAGGRSLRRGSLSGGPAAAAAGAHRLASPQRPLLAPPRAYGPGSSYEQPGYSQGGQQSQFGGGQGWPGQGQQGSTALASADGGGALKAKDAPKTVQVRFWLKFHVDYGQTIRIIGSSDALGAWNLSKAPFLRWSEGDLWNVTLELAAGGVYEYKYVVVEDDGTTAVSWQRGANNVLALQMNDEEVEAYDNWKNAPGSIVLVDGQETTRERKLLSWAGDMTLQRQELRKTRMELAQAREEIRVLRAELSVLRMEVSEANIARAAAEARQLELERANSSLRLEVAASQATARSTMEEAVRLLTTMSDEDASSSDMPAVPTSASAEHGSGDGASSSGGGGGMFGGLFGFQMPGGSNGRSHARVASEQQQDGPGAGPGSAASAVVAAAAAMAAAAAGATGASEHGGAPGQGGNGSSGGGGYSPSGSYTPGSSNGGSSSSAGGGSSSEVVSANVNS